MNVVVLQSLTISQLAGKYNELAPQFDLPPVKKFRDKETAIARVVSLLKKTQEVPERKRALKLAYPVRREIRPVLETESLLGRMKVLLENGGATLEQMDELVIGYDQSKGKVPFNVRFRALKTARRLSRRGYGVLLQDGVVRMSSTLGEFNVR